MIDTLKIDYASIKTTSVQGRYVTDLHIDHLLEKWSKTFKIDTIGKSVLGKKITSVTLGHGAKKILMWSQMHGNESTTTKAVLDLLHLLYKDASICQKVKKTFTITIIPILNPDGALAYTRVNANEVDLNRDAQNRTQPESRILRSVFDDFKPHFCFNLHDQRTIFNVGNTPKPATLSFLSPAFDKDRGVSESREASMKVIAAMNEVLQREIPGQVGRYDDGFNANCVGDTFQMENVPTILFESGHFPEDYQREKTREFIFKSIWTALKVIGDDAFQEYKVTDYFAIPENKKRFFDILIKNVSMLNPTYAKTEKAGVLFKEVLQQNDIHFNPVLDRVGPLLDHYGHKVYDCANTEDLKRLEQNSSILSLFR